ncbi:MAG: inositol monophosphatase family protein [Blastocatellia bacterium]
MLCKLHVRRAQLFRICAARRTDIIHKGRINLVTEADLASEKHIKELITARYPTHKILAEESGISHHEDAEYCWIIDPLDGTTNFAHGLPCYAVSIGVEHKGEVIAGVIYDPTRDEMFAAERGGCDAERKKLLFPKSPNSKRPCS